MRLSVLRPRGPQAHHGKHRLNRVCRPDMLPVRRRKIVGHQHRFLVLHQALHRLGIPGLEALYAAVKSIAGPSRASAIQKWTPKTGQHDKCILGSSRHPGSRFVVNAIRRAPVKRLVPSLGIVEGEIPAQ